MNINIPLVSVILPIYNVEDYLPDCMDSILGQTYTNLEILLIDDGSNKKCSELCDSYKEKDDRIIVFHKTNGGLSDARNYGIERATGEYITCIDSDDYVDKDYVEYLVNLLKKYNTKMSVCQHRIRNKKRIIRDYGNSGDDCLTSKVCIERMLYHDVIDTSAWAKLYHRSLFDNVKYPKGRLFEDIATTYALMLQCPKIAVGYESKYNYIFRNDSIVNSEFKINKLDLLEMTDNMAINVLKIYPELERATIRRRVYARFSTLNQMLFTKEYDDKKEAIIKFIKSNSKDIILNPKTPMRDKLACFLLFINKNLYGVFWKLHLKYKGN